MHPLWKNKVSHFSSLILNLTWYHKKPKHSSLCNYLLSTEQDLFLHDPLGMYEFSNCCLQVFFASGGFRHFLPAPGNTHAYPVLSLRVLKPLPTRFLCFQQIFYCIPIPLLFMGFLIAQGFSVMNFLGFSPVR